jgi:hypothetical protein
MKKITIFLASSNELLQERENFEIEIYRKSKAWSEKGVIFHLDIWEDMSGKLSQTSSQDEYNKRVKSSDLFVILVFTKLGMYTEVEFDNAYEHFKANNKPFIYTYFKDSKVPIKDTVSNFKEKLSKDGHFYTMFKDSNHLWNLFNKELDRLETSDFKKHIGPASSSKNVVKNTELEIEGQIKIGDKGDKKGEFNKKNIVERSKIKSGGDFTLGDS